MTRQHVSTGSDDDNDGVDTIVDSHVDGALPPRHLLLAAREIMRDTAHRGAARDSTNIVAAFGTQRVAVLRVTTPRPSDDATSNNNGDNLNEHAVNGSVASVQLGVFDTHNDPPNDNSTAPSSPQPLPPSPPTPTWTSLWTHDDAAAAQSAAPLHSRIQWSLAWSPDGAFLVVSGAVVDANSHALRARLWLLTTSDWLSRSSSSSSSSLQPPILVPIDPFTSLSLKDVAPTSQIVTLFTAAASSSSSSSHSNSRVFLVLDTAVLATLDVAAATLASQALGSTNSSAPTRLFTLSVVQQLQDWHADVATATFATSTSTLVVSGGIADASDALVRANASSLSVWRVVVDATPPRVELLDCTMVVSATDDDADDAADADAPRDSDQQSVQAPVSRLHLLLSFLTGQRFVAAATGKKKRVLRGSIRHVAVSPTGAFVVVVDKRKRFAIRCIATCSDVVPWQLVEGGGEDVQFVEWMTASVLSVGFQSGRLMFAAFDVNANEALTWLQTQWQFTQNSSSNTQPHVDAIAPMTSTASSTIAGVALVCDNKALVLQQFTSVSVASFVQSLVAAEQFERALTLAALHTDDAITIDVSAIHRRMWLRFREHATQTGSLSDVTLLQTTPSADFAIALQHLEAVDDVEWIVSECIATVAVDAICDMFALLQVGVRVATQANASTKQLELFLNRLETLDLLVAADAGVQLCVGDAMDADDDVINSQHRFHAPELFDGAMFAQFRTASLVDIAFEVARDGRIHALAVLFDRHAFELETRRFDVLTLLPATLSPFEFVHLLPAIGASTEKEDDDSASLYTLQLSPTSSNSNITENELLARVLLSLAHADDDADATATASSPVTIVRRVVVRSQQKSQCSAVDDDDSNAYELFTKQSIAVRSNVLATWFTQRIQSLDVQFGHLRHARTLSIFALVCLQHCRVDDVIQTFATFQQHVERLFICSYSLDLPTTRLLSLDTWCALSLVHQMRCVVGDLTSDSSSVDDAINRLFAVVIASRINAVDDALAALCRLLATETSLAALAVCAQIVHQSNPMRPRYERWLQSDAVLLETAIFVLQNVTPTQFFGQIDHKLFTDALWTIFQSLPVRTPDDDDVIETLQVKLDAIEDLLIAMDVLSLYSIVSCPRELREIVQQNEQAGADLLTQMGQFAFSTRATVEKELSTVDNGAETIWWRVYHDALKLQTHVFNAEFTIDRICRVLLQQLLLIDSIDNAAVETLVQHWLSVSSTNSNDAIVAVLIEAMQQRLDVVNGAIETTKEKTEVAAGYAIRHLVERLLPLLVRDDPERLIDIKQQLQDAQALVDASELLYLLTNGEIRQSPRTLRSLVLPRDRLAIVLSVLTTNPSHFVLSDCAVDWFRRRNVSTDGLLTGVLFVASLLRLNESQRQEILLQGAFAALYCSDFDAAVALTTDVLVQFEAGDDAINRNSSRQIESVLSLVLDLVSASAFASWSKKRLLCCQVLRLDASKLFCHAVVDRILAALALLDAIDALATELNLSEVEIETRRLESEGGGNTKKQSVEEVLLIELALAVDVLEESADVEFKLQLLQKGFALATVGMTAHAMSLEDDEEKSDNDAGMQRMVSLLPTLARSCVACAIHQATATATAYETYRTLHARDAFELALRYVELWRDVDESVDVNAFWANDVVPLLDAASARASVASRASLDALVRQTHQFCLCHVASSAAALEEATDDDNVRQALQTRRQQLELLTHSYSRAKASVAALDDDSNVLRSTLRDSDWRSLATQCDVRLVSHVASQQLEQLSTFLNDAVDVERFSCDASYRMQQLLALSTSTNRSNVVVAQQFAVKYDIDPLVCVFAYIRHAFTQPMLTQSTAASRHEQLDVAFRATPGDADGTTSDVVAQALAAPVAFSRLLLNNTTGDCVYDALDGRDHVGMLLLLRFVLECAKRLGTGSLTEEASIDGALLPLDKAASDRVLLLFLCLKRLKDMAESNAAEDCVILDFKRVCGVARSIDVIQTPLRESEAAQQQTRNVAIAASVPLVPLVHLKTLTKILQKLHHVPPSAVVLIYLSCSFPRLSTDDGAGSSEAAGHAYETSKPLLAVLTFDHAALFYRLLLGRRLDHVTNDADDDVIYGQSLAGLAVYRTQFSRTQRVAIVSDALTLLQAKADAVDGDRITAQTLDAMHCELLNAAIECVVECIEQHDLLVVATTSTHWRSSRHALQQWLEQPVRTTASVESLLESLCACIASVAVASLVVDLVLLATADADASKSTAAQLVPVLYRRVVAAAAHASICNDDDASLDVASFPHVAALFAATLSSVEDTAAALAVLQTVVLQLEAVASPALEQRVVSIYRPLLTTNDVDNTLRRSVQAAVVAEVRALMVQYDNARQFRASAVLGRLLLDATTASSLPPHERLEVERWVFGVQTKAVLDAALVQQPQQKRNAAAMPTAIASLRASVDAIERMASDCVFDAFDSVFCRLLAFVTPSIDEEEAAAVAIHVTHALTHLLALYDAVAMLQQQRQATGHRTWHDEQQRAVAQRLCEQFALETIDTVENVENVENAAVSTADTSTTDTWWAVLLLHGRWRDAGARVVWYCTSEAYDRIRSSDAIEAVAAAYWDLGPSARRMCVELMLASPFDALHAHHRDRLLAFAACTDISDDDTRRVLELLLLRFDVSTLLVAKLLPHLVAAATTVETPATTSAQLWTASGEYLVCALVMVHERAVAARLASALWRVAPLLWDFETARLTLANYLHALVRVSIHKSNTSIEEEKDSSEELRIAACRQALQHFEATQAS